MPELWPDANYDGDDDGDNWSLIITIDDNNDGFDGSIDNFGGPENQVPSPLFSVTFNSRPFVA